jgi:hypothetical protein
LTYIYIYVILQKRYILHPQNSVASKWRKRMQYADKEGWDKFVANNSDIYGSGVIRFAERWANLMEAKISKGAKLEDIAKATSQEADSEGITGFMYGCAVSTLSHAWIHGEALRRWHNLDTQIGNEGERANANGGVLNPAILNIATK